MPPLVPQVQKAVHGQGARSLPARARLGQLLGGGHDIEHDGLSHGKIAEFCGDVLKAGGSRSWPYRNKMAAARRREPKYDATRRDILREPYLQCDEMW